MRVELQHDLFNRYPKLFRKPGDGDPRPIDERGIECGDGWLVLVDSIANIGETEIDNLIACGHGQDNWPRAAQVKEKFGSLRFYFDRPVSERLSHQKAIAELASAITCEQCGSARNPEMQTTTLCEKCRGSVEEQ